MAKAGPIEGIAPSDPYGVVAGAVIDVRTDELLEHSEGVLDMDRIERLHDMRVATRRLRAALEVFEACFPRKPFKAALREVKALADALGRRRDPDVTGRALREIADSVSAADRPGVQSLAEAIEAERATANQGLVGELDPQRLEALAARLHSLAASARERAGR